MRFTSRMRTTRNRAPAEEMLDKAFNQGAEERSAVFSVALVSAPVLP